MVHIELIAKGGEIYITDALKVLAFFWNVKFLKLHELFFLLFFLQKYHKEMLDMGKCNITSRKIVIN